MTTITNEQLKDKNVIAELNDKFANKKIVQLKIYNSDSLIISFSPSEYDVNIAYSMYFNLTSLNPYFHILLYDNEFTRIDIYEVD